MSVCDFRAHLLHRPYKEDLVLYRSLRPSNFTLILNIL